MTTRTQIIQEIINRIDKISEDKLKDILDFIEETDDLSKQKESILSFAGKWNNLDKELLSDLTKNLHKNRMKNNRIIK